jgi:hypothetical protein
METAPPPSWQRKRSRQLLHHRGARSFVTFVGRMWPMLVGCDLSGMDVSHFYWEWSDPFRQGYSAGWLSPMRDGCEPSGTERSCGEVNSCGINICAPCGKWDKCGKSVTHVGRRVPHVGGVTIEWEVWEAGISVSCMQLIISLHTFTYIQYIYTFITIVSPFWDT